MTRSLFQYYFMEINAFIRIDVMKKSKKKINFLNK